GTAGGGGAASCGGGGSAGSRGGAPTGGASTAPCGERRGTGVRSYPARACTSRNDSANSIAEAGRSSGSLARAWRNARSSPGGASGRPTEPGDSVRIRRTVVFMSELANGDEPDANWNNVAASEYTSAAIDARPSS